MSKRKAPASPEPLAGVDGAAIYWFRDTRRGSESWWDGCVAIEEALIRNGWSPPAGYVAAARARKTESVTEPIVTLRLSLLTLTSEEGRGVILAIDRDGKRTEGVRMRLAAALWLAQTIQAWADKPELYEGPTAMWLTDGEPAGVLVEPAPAA